VAENLSAWLLKIITCRQVSSFYLFRALAKFHRRETLPIDIGFLSIICIVFILQCKCIALHIKYYSFFVLYSTIGGFLIILQKNIYILHNNMSQLLNNFPFLLIVRKPQICLNNEDNTEKEELFIYLLNFKQQQKRTGKLLTNYKSCICI